MLGSHGRSWSGMLVLSPVRCSYLGRGGEGGGDAKPSRHPLSQNSKFAADIFHFLRKSLLKLKKPGWGNRLRNLVRAHIMSALKSLTHAVRISRIA